MSKELGNISDRRWITPKEAANYLSIHLHSVYKLLAQHKLPGAKMPGVGWRIDRKKIDEWFETEIKDRERGWEELLNRIRPY